MFIYIYIYKKRKKRIKKIFTTVKTRAVEDIQSYVFNI